MSAKDGKKNNKSGRRADRGPAVEDPGSGSARDMPPSSMTGSTQEQTETWLREMEMRNAEIHKKRRRDASEAWEARTRARKDAHAEIKQLLMEDVDDDIVDKCIDLPTAISLLKKTRKTLSSVRKATAVLLDRLVVLEERMEPVYLDLKEKHSEEYYSYEARRGNTSEEAINGITARRMYMRRHADSIYFD